MPSSCSCLAGIINRSGKFGKCNAVYGMFFCRFAVQLIAQQVGDSACLTFYLKRKRYAYGWSCAAAFRIPKLTPAAKGKIKYGVSALNKILVSKWIIDGENSH